MCHGCRDAPFSETGLSKSALWYLHKVFLKHSLPFLAHSLFMSTFHFSHCQYIHPGRAWKCVLRGIDWARKREGIQYPWASIRPSTQHYCFSMPFSICFLSNSHGSILKAYAGLACIVSGLLHLLLVFARTLIKKNSKSTEKMTCLRFQSLEGRQMLLCHKLNIDGLNFNAECVLSAVMQRGKTKNSPKRQFHMG